MCIRDSCNPGGAGCRSFFHADAHRRDCISVPRLPPFAVWAASGGWFSALGSGRRQVCYVSVSGKLTSGQHGPKQERVASSPVSYTHLVAVLVLVLLLLVCYILSAVSSIFPTLGSGLANAVSGTSYALSLIHI